MRGERATYGRGQRRGVGEQVLLLCGKRLLELRPHLRLRARDKHGSDGKKQCGGAGARHGGVDRGAHLRCADAANRCVNNVP